MLTNHQEVTWRIVPQNTPSVMRHCSKCNRKMPYNCSEKFRMNSNAARVDIWLIYKCSKCDNTLKLAIHKGVHPQDISREQFNRFTHNDAKLAWDYAFNRNFLKQNECVVQYGDVAYDIEGFVPQKWDTPITVYLKSEHFFELKLSALLARALGISIGKLRGIVQAGLISVDPLRDVMKYRIKSDIDILIQPHS